MGNLESVAAGQLYTLLLNGTTERPDPASRCQPEGVHGASAIVSSTFPWTDQCWAGVPLRDYIIYELHVGTFTKDGTLDAIIPRLRELKDLGVTAVELMPIAQFPGRRWGYDGVFPCAVQNSYGGPEGLKRLVNAAHAEGLSVVLDIVYNHLGPEGNNLRDFGPYFTDRYKTPWGDALNFDGEHSDHVRRFFIENALYWQTEFHIDALRLEAVHAIHDKSAFPFLIELARATRARSEELNRRFCLIGESDLNDARLIAPESLGGKGLDAQWSDDLHHCLHVLLTHERSGYYADYGGGVRQLAKALDHGFAYTGEYSTYRKRKHGNSAHGTRPEQHVVCSQNHDQIGNRLVGERLGQLTSYEGLKLAAATVLLSPFTPLLFMGEEWGEQPPFRYFISHSEPSLVEAVRQGRKAEFAAFGWQGEVPDPQAETAFTECIIDPSRCGERHLRLREFYRELISLRKETRHSATPLDYKHEVFCYESQQTIALLFRAPETSFLVLLCFSEDTVELSALTNLRGSWRKRLDSAGEEWFGPGDSADTVWDGSSEIQMKPFSAVLYEWNTE